MRQDVVMFYTKWHADTVSPWRGDMCRHDDRSRSVCPFRWELINNFGIGHWKKEGGIF